MSSRKLNINWKNREQIRKYYRDYFDKKRRELNIKPNLNIRGSKIKYCASCKIKLTSLNWSKHNKKEGNYFCIKCQNREVCKYSKLHYLDTTRDGVKLFLKGNKRLRPLDNKCELCLSKRYLVYHHWDDNDISKGIWCCYFCHSLVELIDRKFNLWNIINNYSNLKNNL
jgi:hypothetical protein